jgi:general secretion pathway protein D
MLIITDMGSNIRRMLRVLEAVDVPRTGEQIWIEPIHYANATELAARLQEIFQVGQASAGGGGAAQRPQRPARAQRANQQRRTPQAAGGTTSTVGSSAGESRITKILPDERTNSLILVATERAYLRILEMIRQLDVPLEGEGRIHVHYVQHGDAEEISSTLSSLISGSTSARPTGGRAGQAQAAAAGGGGDLFEGDIRVTAHKPSNALVITSSLHDYAALRRVIDRLDAPRRQVFIEAVIMEMTVDRTRSLGLSFHGGAADFPSDGSLLLGGSNAADSLGFGLTPESLTGLALGVRGPEIPESTELIGFSIPAFGVALNALATSGDGNVLSTPHIIAIDNEEAEISVGSNVPLQTSGFNTGGLGTLGALAGAQGAQGLQGAAGLSALSALGGGFNVPRQDVGTTIKLTPHINDADEIRLEIEEEISEAAPSTEGTLGVRSVSKRTAKTQMVVQDQQTVVIGGLMRDRVIHEETKIPILGDIPLLGVLFRQTRRDTKKTNLLLFLTPYIIRDASDLRSIFERKMRERQEFIDRYFVFGDHEYQPPVDYTRTRGLVAEIINELGEIDEERQLMEAMQARPPPEHVARAPVGAAPEMGDGEPEEGDIIIGPDGEMETIEVDEGPPPSEPETEPDIE